MIAMLFAVLAVFVVTKYSKNKFMPLLGGLFISLSMGMYQTYLSVTMVLFASLILIDLLNKENLKDVVKNGLKYLLSGVIGLVLYFIFMNLALSMRQLDMNSYSGANEIGLSNIKMSLKDFPTLHTLYDSKYNMYFTNNNTIIIIFFLNQLFIKKKN